MKVTAADIKSLREKTKAGMMDCKNALVEANGDLAKAEAKLKKLGLAAVDKRQDRATKEGRVFSRIQGESGVLLELSCETDFVARNNDFIRLGENLVSTILNNGIRDKGDDALASQIKESISIIKENIALRRFAVLETGDGEFLTEYIHGEGRIGVIVKTQVGGPVLKDNSRVKETAFDFALQVAAFAPVFISRDRVDQEYLAEKEEAFRMEAEKLGKPEKILQGIVKGKLNKHLTQICLMDQGFVRDEKVKCSQILTDLSNEVGASVAITDFLYYKVGGEI